MLKCFITRKIFFSLWQTIPGVMVDTHLYSSTVIVTSFRTLTSKTLVLSSTLFIAPLCTEGYSFSDIQKYIRNVMVPRIDTFILCAKLCHMQEFIDRAELQG